MKVFVIEPFPNEHIFSWLLRMYRLSGYGDFVTYQKSLGIEDRHLHTYKVFSSTTETLISLFDNRDHAIQSHTTIPIWQISVGCLLGDNQLKLNAFKQMDEEQSFGFDTSWHSCERCRVHDQEKYGTAYWHASHQLTSVFECYKHQCILEKAEAPVTNLFEETFPHEVPKWIPLLTESKDDLKKWQSFYVNINELAMIEQHSVMDIKANLFQILGLKGKLLKQRKHIGIELNQQFISALGPTLLAYIFRDYARPQRRKELNVVNVTFTNVKLLKGERHPIFLAALAYWKRSELNI